MRLVTFDLDDTLMACGMDYVEGRQAFAAFMAERHGFEQAEVVETIQELDSENVEEFGLKMERYPMTFVETYDQLVDTPVDAERETVREFGYSVFKTAEEYAERGFMEGAEELLTRLNAVGFDLHLITAGDERVQNRKIEGLELDRYFDETHVTPLNGKADMLQQLMEEYDYGTDETFLIGNSLSSDIKAALDAGARGIYIPTHEWRPIENREFYETHDRVDIYPTLTEFAQDVPGTLTDGVSTDTMPQTQSEIA